MRTYVHPKKEDIDNAFGETVVTYFRMKLRKKDKKHVCDTPSSTALYTIDLPRTLSYNTHKRPLKIFRLRNRETDIDLVVSKRFRRRKRHLVHAVHLKTRERVRQRRENSLQKLKEFDDPGKIFVQLSLADTMTAIADGVPHVCMDRMSQRISNIILKKPDEDPNFSFTGVLTAEALSKLIKILPIFVLDEKDIVLFTLQYGEGKRLTMEEIKNIKAKFGLSYQS